MFTIIGCGNTNRRDDGVGSYVVAQLKKSMMPSDVRLFDAGTSGMEVMFKAKGSTSLTIIDACRSGSEPGAIFKLPGEEIAACPEPSYNLHDFRWDHAIFAGKKIFKEDFPEDISVFLIEAEDVSYGLELSDKVKTAGDRVVELVLESIKSRRNGAGNGTHIKLRDGKLYIDADLYERYFAGLDTVALIERADQLLLLPIHSNAAGGLMIKVRNSKGDRVIDGVDFLRRVGLDSPAERLIPAYWDSTQAGLVLDCRD
ncbi:MAG: hydrogenase maturation protease [Cyanobacteria bacterium]|nr:hydrogenase maturation protease [Cyanobacteriota bacterium]